MTYDQFRASLTDDQPPAGLAPLVVALWHDARGNWDEAHRITQDINGGEAAWIHAYLHRKEGDTANAAYWYRRAGRHPVRVSLDLEWQEIVSTLLGD